MRRGVVLCIGLVGTSTGAVATVATARLAWQLQPGLPPAGNQQLVSPQPADLLLALAAGALAVLLARLTGCALTLVAAAAAPGSRRVRGFATALSPRLLRPLVVTVLGVGLGLGGAGAAAASSGPSAVAAHRAALSVGWTADGDRAGHRPARTGEAGPPVLVRPGWVATPPRTPTTAGGDVHLVSSGRTAAQPDGTVVVRRGDCLWTLAARQLGDQAGDVQVGEQWHRWWAANRATIGDDPDLLVPGTRLVVPSTAASRR